MTLVLDVRPYQRLDVFDRMAVDAQIKDFLAHIRKTYNRPAKTHSSPPVCVQNGNGAIVAVIKPDTVSPLPEAPELDMSFIPETESQKRTRKPRENSDDSAPVREHDRTLKDRIAALIAERGPVTSADIGQYLAMNRRRAAVTIIDMQKQKRLFVVGYKKNEYNQTVKVLHTDPNFVYVQPEPEVAAEPIVEEKRPARIPSIAAVDRGRALVARNFSRDSIAMQVFEQLCLRPRSIPELERLFRRGSSCFKFMLDRMQGLGIVEKVGQDRNAESGKLRALFGVAEAEAAPPPPRVPPSPETIAKGAQSSCVVA